MTDIGLKTALASYGHTTPLKDGRVRPRGVELQFEDVPVIIQAFRRMVRGLEFDVSEMAITTYICARDHGKAFTALPIFIMRGLHHGAVLHNVKSGVRTPKDLEGKRVGVNRGYTVTTGLWARSILQHQYGVDLKRITWVLSGDEHVAEYRPPSNVVPIQSGKKLEDLVISGEIPAAIGIKVDSPDVKPLIPNAEEAGFEQLRTRALYPINHTVVVKNELLASRPNLARDLFDGFAEAKRIYVRRLKEGSIQEPSPNDRLYRKVMDVTGDPLPYGIEPNRAVLEMLVERCVEQGIIRRPVDVPDLFAAGTHDLTA
jgi:4,5-dihydroxyphthalate decarboxylase